jgi:hypothetical protein
MTPACNEVWAAFPLKTVYSVLPPAPITSTLLSLLFGALLLGATRPPSPLLLINLSPGVLLFPLPGSIPLALAGLTPSATLGEKWAFARMPIEAEIAICSLAEEAREGLLCIS